MNFKNYKYSKLDKIHFKDIFKDTDQLLSTSRKSNSKGKIRKKQNVITDKLPDAKTEDVLEVMLFLMINKGIVNDVNEFVEIFQSIKVADKLLEAE